MRVIAAARTAVILSGETLDLRWGRFVRSTRNAADRRLSRHLHPPQTRCQRSNAGGDPRRSRIAQCRLLDTERDGIPKVWHRSFASGSRSAVSLIATLGLRCARLLHNRRTGGGVVAAPCACLFEHTGAAAPARRLLQDALTTTRQSRPSTRSGAVRRARVVVRCATAAAGTYTLVTLACLLELELDAVLD